MSGSGLPALIYAGAWLGNEFDMEALSCGRGAVSDADCVLEICGRFLFFTITLRAGGVTVAAQPMDTGDASDLLLRAADNPGGWQTVRGLIAALERHEIKSLTRPIEAGTGEFGGSSGEGGEAKAKARQGQNCGEGGAARRRQPGKKNLRARQRRRAGSLMTPAPTTNGRGWQIYEHHR